MVTITSIRQMQEWADAARLQGQKIGLVPTMGYLHAGHLSLVQAAHIRCDLVVASIFVNPLQFGAGEDLATYPRDIAGDCRLLQEYNTDVLFLPTADEMYPSGFQTSVTVEKVTQGLCGKDRPVHFRGVATVVTKLFLAVKPHIAVFGCKDYQQLVTIRRMVRDLNFAIEVIGVPTVREADGLAMSSRNAYLTAEERQAALCIPAALRAARRCVADGERQSAVVQQVVAAVIAAEPLARLSYAELVNPDTMETITSLEQTTLLALAVSIGKSRLIDNCLLKPDADQSEY